MTNEPPGKRLSAEHREHLRGSGLSDETIRLAGVYTETDRREIARLLNWKAWRGEGTVLVIPFRYPGAAEPHLFRLRPDRPREAKRKDGSVRLVKYEQPKGAPAPIYFEPRSSADGSLQDPARPLFFTEGEKKTLALGQLGRIAVGAVGVSTFHDVALKQSTGDSRLHPDLVAHVTVLGRDCRIVFDADAATNDDVLFAERRLAGMLAAAGAARVSVVRIPLVEGGPKGIDDFLVAHGADATLALLEQLHDVEPIAPTDPLPRITSWRALREMPHADQHLRTPPGYSVEPDGSLWFGDDEDRVKVSDRTIVPLRLLLDHKSGAEYAEVCFRRHRDWKRVITTRGVLANTRKVIDLADEGAPVSSENARAVVGWLSAFEETNEATITRAVSLRTQGWHEVDGRWVFAMGSEVFGIPEGLPIEYTGESRVTTGVCRRGDAATSLEALCRGVGASGYCAASVMAALAAPLLRPLDAPNVLVHLCGDSSVGKSSMLKIALSVWGNPSSSDLVMSANATQVGLEYRAGLMNDLALAMDESGMADQEDSIQRVYMMSDGTGRTRGTRDGGLRDTLRWRTIMLSTGEKPLIGEDSPTGTKARVLNLPVDGFGALGANDVDELRGITEQHYGHAGRAWVQRLVQNTDWLPWRARLAEIVKELRSSVRPGGPRARQAGYWALLVVTEMLAARLLELGDREGATMRRLFHSLSDSATPSAAERALELLSAHRLRNPESWVEVQPNGNGHMEPKDWERKRNIVGYHTESRVFLIPDAARELFQRHALDWSVVWKHWRDMELVELDPTGNNPRVRIAGRRVRMVVLDESFLSGADEPGHQQELFQDTTGADDGFVEF